MTRQWWRPVRVLGVIWVIDGLLQLQPDHFTSDFSADLAANAMAQPRVFDPLFVNVAGWLTPHVALWNLCFAIFEVVLGVAIIHSRTRTAALALSIPWALAIWVVGEGLGGVATGYAMPAYGFPGAALLYACVAVVCLADRSGSAGNSKRAGDIGRAIWTVIWLGGAVAQATPSFTPGFKYLADSNALADGEPRSIAKLDSVIGGFLANHGIGTTALFTIVACAVAFAPWLAPRVRGLGWMVGIVLVCGAVFGENLGGILSGDAFDVGAMPLFGLLAFTFWGRPAFSPFPADEALVARGVEPVAVRGERTPLVRAR